MAKGFGSEYNEYKYHNWKLCQMSLDFPLSTLSHSPLEIQVEVTTHCNLQCMMCIRPSIVTHPAHLHPDILSKLYPLFPSAVKVVPFGGGEPLLYPHFNEVVEYAKHCGAQVTFDTNGILLNESLSQTFVSLGVDTICFSIDSPKEETYQAIRKGSIYSKVIDNLAALNRLKQENHQRKPVIAIAFVPMVDNVWDIPELLYLARKLGVQWLFFGTLIHPDPDWGHAYLDFYRQHSLANLPQTELSTYFQSCKTLAKKLNLLICPPDYFSIFEKQKSLSFQDGVTPSRATSVQRKNNKSTAGSINRGAVACTNPWTTIYVNANGIVQTCCFSARVLGDLKVQEFSEIWNGIEFQRYRDQIINKEYPIECQNCLADGRNRETIPQLVLTKEQLWSTWKGSTREIMNRLYGKLRYPFHRK